MSEVLSGSVPFWMVFLGNVFIVVAMIVTHDCEKEVRRRTHDKGSTSMSESSS